jgi:hypothetical protein
MKSQDFSHNGELTTGDFTEGTQDAKGTTTLPRADVGRPLRLCVYESGISQGTV